jgi:predicted deacylase
MKIGAIEAQPGQKAYGAFKSGETHGRFDVHIPMHVIVGSQPGPTLVVQAGASGLEIEPSLILPQLAGRLDPATIAGTVVIVPLMNTSGFEFEQIESIWDNKHLNRIGRGNPAGTVSEQLIDAYYRAVLADADALLDIRTGSQWSYHRFAGVFSVGAADRSKALALALGLPQVLLDLPPDQSMAYEAAQDGKAVVAAYIGGGPGLRDYREADLRRIENAVLNAMRSLNMIDGALMHEAALVQVLSAPTLLMPQGERGLTFMNTRKRGTPVSAGEELGTVRHPFTGEVVERITAPRAGVVVHAGASWPLAPEDHVLAILAQLDEEVNPAQRS